MLKTRRLATVIASHAAKRNGVAISFLQARQTALSQARVPVQTRVFTENGSKTLA